MTMQSRATTSGRPSPIRQDYLQSALKWISGGNIEEYTSKHQFDDNASELWQYFQTVINWTRILFPNYRKEMRGFEWGDLYNTYRNNFYDFQKNGSRSHHAMAFFRTAIRGEEDFIACFLMLICFYGNRNRG